MLKGSFSLSMLRWSDDVLETLVRFCQKFFFSGGDGCGVLVSGWESKSSRLCSNGAYREIHAAVIDFYDMSATTSLLGLSLLRIMVKPGASCYASLN